MSRLSLNHTLWGGYGRDIAKKRRAILLDPPRLSGHWELVIFA